MKNRKWFEADGSAGRTGSGRDDAGNPRRYWTPVDVLGTLGMVLGVGLGQVMVVAVGVSLVVGLFPFPAPRYEATSQKIALAQYARPLALERDGLSPEEAGDLVAGLDALPRWSQPCERDLVPDSPLASTLGLRCLDHQVAFEAADRGLTSAERAHIEAHLDVPSLPVLRALARARGFHRPLKPELAAAERRGELTFSWDLEVPKLGSLRSAAYVMVAYAALLHNSGDSEGAEHVLREVISAGLVLVDDGETLIEALIGATITRVGMEGMIELYERMGREPVAEHLRVRIESPNRRDRRPKASKGPLGYSKGGLPYWDGLLRDRQAARGLRWEAVNMAGITHACGDARTILFGPTRGQVAALRAARADLVRSPASEVTFEILTTSVERVHAVSDWRFGIDDAHFIDRAVEGWLDLVRVPVELSAWVLQNPRIDGCFWLFASQF